MTAGRHRTLFLHVPLKGHWGSESNKKVYQKALYVIDTVLYFLLLARYVPNVAKRSRPIWDQCKKKYILRTDRRPTDDQRPTDLSRLSLGKIQMAISRQGVVRSTSVWFYGGVFGGGGWNGANSGLTKFIRYLGENNAQGVIRLVTI